MADDATFQPTTPTYPPTDLVVAADEIALKKYQRVKLIQGIDGVNDGDVSATAPLQVTLANGSVPSHAVTNAGTFAVQAAQSGTWTVQPGNTANTTAWKVDGSAVTQPVSGTITATIAAAATTIAKAEDAASADADVGVPSMAVRKATPANTSGLDGDYEFLQMSAGRLWASATIDAALPAGTNAIGKLSANSGVDIGDVDILSIAAGDNNIGNVDIVTVPADPFGANADAASATGSISAKLRFIAATGIPVTGTVSVDSELTTADLDTGVGTDTRAVVGLVYGASGGGVLVSTTNPLPVADNGGSLTVDNAGTFAVQAAVTAASGSISSGAVASGAFASGAMASGSIAAGAIADMIVDDAAFTPATSRVLMAGFEFDDVTPDSVNEGDAGAARMSANRNIYTTLRDAAGNERGANVNASSQLSVSVDNTVTVASHAVTNAGTFVTQVDGAALTALQKIDDPVLVDDAAFTPATSSVMMAGFEFDDTLPDSVDEGDAGAARMSANRNQYVQIRDNAGNERGLNIDASGQLAVTLAAAQTLGTVTTVSTVTNVATIGTSVTPGTAAANLGKAEDAVHATGDTGVMALAVRSNTAASTSGTDGDYQPLITNTTGHLWVDASGQTLTVASHAVTNAGTFATQSAITAASGSIASGAIASGAVASGAFASGALASGSIAAGAIATGATSIAANEDDASANLDTGVKILARRTATPANTSGTDLDYEMLQMANGALWTAPLGFFATVSTDVTRPADVTAYAANDALSDSTTAPTSGGFTFTSAARKSGGSGIITDAIITTSADAATLLQGEIWIFDTAVTNINDNTAFAVSDTEIKTYVGKIPFTLEDAGNNGAATVQNLSLGFTCVGSANLRYLVKVKNAYTPASAEVLTVRLKIIQVD